LTLTIVRGTLAVMKRPAIANATRALALLFFGGAVVACYGEVRTGGVEECRTAEVRSRHDVEVCNEHCNDRGCHEHCSERERYSREHRCWVE
jgi:hypothetical protein